MFWKRTTFFIYLVGLVLGYISMAANYSFPGMVSYLALARGKATGRHATITYLRKRANEGGDGSEIHGRDEICWSVRISGGPLGTQSESFRADQPVAEQLERHHAFHVGGQVEIVRVGGLWLPPWEAKLRGLFGIPLFSVMLLAVAALILRCAIGPRAFPGRYEAASYDVGQSINGLPTRRVVAILAWLAIGFALMIWQVFFDMPRLLQTSVGYWLGFTGDLLFLLQGPVLLWAALPRVRRVGTS